MEIAGPVVVGAAELYFVIDCAASKGDKLKSKSRRGAMFDPNRLLCNEFACSKFERWERVCAWLFPCEDSIVLGCVVFAYAALESDGRLY